MNSFVVPLLMRQYHLKLTAAASVTGIIVGITGLIGLLLGARYADKASARSPRARLMIGVGTSALAAPLTALALLQHGGNVVMFTLLFSAGWLLAYGFYISVYPAIHDVVVPRLRGTATALFFAAMYLLGGFSGPVAVGGDLGLVRQACTCRCRYREVGSVRRRRVELGHVSRADHVGTHRGIHLPGYPHCRQGLRAHASGAEPGLTDKFTGGGGTLRPRHRRVQLTVIARVDNMDRNMSGKRAIIRCSVIRTETGAASVARHSSG